MTISTREERPELGQEPKWGAIPIDSFAVRLILARYHAGDLTVRDAAERCGLNYGSWSNWERGSKPRDLLDIIEAISESLGIDRDWLLFGGPLATAKRSVRRRGDQPRPGTGPYPVFPDPDRLSGPHRLIGWGIARQVRPAQYRPSGHPPTTLRRAA